MKARDKAGNEVKNQRIDDGQEQAKRHDEQRQREQHQNGPQDRIQNAE